ncbi:alpha/beta fold hydrolase [Winogradskya humida]|uniref:alpha/beta fold hydrolase n=1 Tax=Winogradskya humida TaxID=113566 RepID=UPI003F68DBC8
MAPAERVAGRGEEGGQPVPAGRQAFHRRAYGSDEVSPVLDDDLLDRPGNDEIQLDYFLDYGTNPALYPPVQQWLRDNQPPTLIVWGANDVIFPAEGAHPYKRDLKDAEFHLFDSGHFLLEDRADEVFPLIHDFLTRKLG